MADRRLTVVVKRDGTHEPFEVQKLRGCLLCVMPPGGQAFHYAEALAMAVRCYLRRRRVRCITSPALLEMLLAVLKGVGMPDSAARLEDHHTARVRLRNRLQIDHGDRQTGWSKQWLAEHACRKWGLGRGVGRIVAGRMESELTDLPTVRVARADLMDMLEAEVAAWGLIPACPLLLAGA